MMMQPNSLRTCCLLFFMGICLMLLDSSKVTDAFMVQNPSQSNAMIKQTRLHMSSIVSDENRGVTNSIRPTIDNTESNQGTNMYAKNVKSRWIELPASSVNGIIQRQQAQRLELLEQMIGRIAMAGAVGILIRECQDGQSIIEQVMNIM